MRAVFLIIAAALSMAAQQSTTSNADAERYIRDSESQWAEAVATGDLSVVKRVLADDFIGVDAGDGHLYPKAEAISWIQDHHTEFVFNHVDEVKVRFYGNTAVAQGSESWERRIGEPRRGRFVWTDTWVLRNGQWQIVAAEDLIAPPLSAKAGNSDDDLSTAKQQVLDLEQEWVSAEHNHDAAALRRILDDKFVSSFGAKKPYDKEAFIKEIVSGDVDPTESETLTDRTVIIDHDTAVVVGTDTQCGTRKGAPYTAVYRYTVTYIRRNGQWLAIAEHLVEAPQAK
jgi:ketosteroid isomerase-like protein